MILNVFFPKNLRTVSLVKQKNIPCICRISSQIFEIIFQSPITEASGTVKNWDRQKIEERALAAGGGKYTHHDFGLVTLKEIEEGVYEIIDLSIFYESFGWCPILINGEYGPPGDFWDEDDGY